jgi:hypothetical protein
MFATQPKLLQQSTCNTKKQNKLYNILLTQTHVQKIETKENQNLVLNKSSLVVAQNN